jgi:hypothetical protein
MLGTMLKEAEAKRLRNTNLASNLEDDDHMAEYQRIATAAARSVKGITKEMEDLTRVLAGKQREDDTREALTALGEQAVERLRQADFDDKRRTLLALDAKLIIRRKADPNAVEFECRLSERFDPTQLSVQGPL